MKIKPNFILHQTAGFNILFSVGVEKDMMGKYFTLNGTGVEIWKAIEQGAEEQDIVQLLVEKYDVSVELAQKEVHKLIMQFKEERIIE